MISVRKLPLVWALCAVTITAPVLAQSKKELVAKVVQLQQADAEGIARAIAAQALQPRLQAAGQAMGGVPADKREALGKEVQADLKKTAGEIETLLRDKAVKLAPSTFGPLLEENFTDDELRQTISWLESGAAKKFQQIGGVFQNALAKKLVDDTRSTVEPKLRALDENLKARFAAAGAAARASGPAKK